MSYKPRPRAAANRQRGAPSEQGRMIVAFAMFVALLTLVAFVLIYKSNQLTKTASHDSKRTTEAHAPLSPAPIFYDRIGTGASQIEPNRGMRMEGKSTFTLELKVTNSRTEAEALIDDLQADGIDAYYTPLTRDGRVVYRVRRGLFNNSEEAQKAAVALKKNQGIASKITKLQ